VGDQAPKQHSFLFADLSGFTVLTEVHGDEEAADLVEEFVAEVRALLPEHRAEEVKCIGDAVMIRCDDATQAVRLGVRIVTEIGERHGFPMVRVGINTGSAVERAGDWFGATVNLAARVAGAAVGGEALITEATRTSAEPLEQVRVVERGRRMLKNLAEPVRLYAATAEGELASDGFPIDPVCRMAVDPSHSAGSLRHAGIEYFFCSLACARAFASDPARHVADRGHARARDPEGQDG
jgi:adenylate cyclase